MKTKEIVLSEVSGIPVYRLTADDKGEYITKSGALKAMEIFANQTPNLKEIHEALDAEIQRLEKEHQENGIKFCDDDEMPDYDYLYLRALRNQQKGLEKAMKLIIKLEISKNTATITMSPEVAKEMEKVLDIKELSKNKAVKLHVVNGEVWGGYDGDKKMALDYLQPEKIYHIQKTEIHEWDTDVYLEEVQGIPFNSVMFETVRE